MLSYGRPLEADISETAEDFLRKTANYWQTWVMRSSIPSIYQEQVIRSSLVLKLHQYEDTGAIIAAGTTSLPEAPNTQRNWDYRYCWPRDAYYTLQAFNSISHFSELESYSHFMQNLVIQSPTAIRPLYAIDGSSQITEKELPHLSGFLGHRPVRIGNGAHTQEQFDIYGQILLSLLPLFIDQRLAHKELQIAKPIIYALVANMENSFDRPDSGIWEFRHQLRHHTHTYLFHWAGASAAEKMALVFRDEALLKRARALKEQACQFIEKAYDPQRKCYSGSLDHQDLDASTLLLINMHYLHPNGTRAQDHVAAMERELTAENGLLYRYRHLDDFGSTESCFLVCSFWHVEALAKIGKFTKAKEQLDRLQKCANHLGLFSEDIYGANYQQWGNFPQTYCHVGLINSIFALDKAMDREIFQLPI